MGTQVQMRCPEKRLPPHIQNQEVRVSSTPTRTDCLLSVPRCVIDSLLRFLIPGTRRADLPAVRRRIQCNLRQFLLDPGLTACDYTGLAEGRGSYRLALVLSSLDILGLSLTSRPESPFAFPVPGKWEDGEFVADE